MWYTHTHTHTHTGILLSHKKAWNLAICDYTEISRVYDAKGKKQTEKDKYCWSHLYVKSQKQNKGTNKNEKRFINTENKQVVVRGKKGGRKAETDEEN